MKKFTLLFTVLFAAFVINAQNVAINNDGSSAEASAMLDVKSTTKGFMMPRVTSAQRTSIASPALGLLVFDITTNTIWAYNGSSWSNLTSAGGGSLTLPFSQTVNVIDPVFQLENNGTGNVIMIRNNSSGVGLHLYSNNGVGIDASSANNIGIKATSSTSNAIHAYTDNPNNTIPTIRANNFGGGPGLWANSAVDNGAYGTTAGIGKSGLRGDGTGESSNGVFGATTSATGNGVSGFNAGGVGVLGTSTSNYGVKGVTNTATGFAGVHGLNNGTAGTGVLGVSHAANTQGVYGSSNNGIGVRGLSSSGTALYGNSTTGYALETNGKVKIAGGNTNPGAGKILMSDADGNATWQQPASTPDVIFKASGVIDGFPELPYQETVKIQFKTQEYDLGNNYISVSENGNPSESSVFYVPFNGVYHFDVSVAFDLKSVAGSFIDYEFTIVTIHKIRNGIDSYITSFTDEEPGERDQVRGSTDIMLNAGDRIYITAFQSNGLLVRYDMPLDPSSSLTSFSAHLVKKL